MARSHHATVSGIVLPEKRTAIRRRASTTHTSKAPQHKARLGRSLISDHHACPRHVHGLTHLTRPILHIPRIPFLGTRHTPQDAPCPSSPPASQSAANQPASRGSKSTAAQLVATASTHAVPRRSYAQAHNTMPSAVQQGTRAARRKH